MNKRKELGGERILTVLNGCTEGDWEGEFTYVGTKESSEINY